MGVMALSKKSKKYILIGGAAALAWNFLGKPKMTRAA